MQTGLEKQQLGMIRIFKKRHPLDSFYLCQGISTMLGWLYTSRICQKNNLNRFNTIIYKDNWAFILILMHILMLYFQ